MRFFRRLNNIVPATLLPLLLSMFCDRLSPSTSLGADIVADSDRQFEDVAANFKAYNGNIPVTGVRSFTAATDTLEPGVHRDEGHIISGIMEAENAFAYLEFALDTLKSPGFRDTLIRRYDRGEIQCSLKLSLHAGQPLSATQARVYETSKKTHNDRLDTTLISGFPDQAITPLSLDQSDTTYSVALPESSQSCDSLEKAMIKLRNQIISAPDDTAAVDSFRFDTLSFCIHSAGGLARWRYGNDDVPYLQVTYQEADESGPTGGTQTIRIYSTYGDYTVLESNTRQDSVAVSSWAARRITRIGLDLRDYWQAFNNSKRGNGYSTILYDTLDLPFDFALGEKDIDNVSRLSETESPDTIAVRTYITADSSAEYSNFGPKMHGAFSTSSMKPRDRNSVAIGKTPVSIHFSNLVKEGKPDTAYLYLAMSGAGRLRLNTEDGEIIFNKNSGWSFIEWAVPEVLRNTAVFADPRID